MTARFTILGFAFALIGCPSAVGDDSDPTANAPDAAADGGAHAPRKKHDAGTDAAPADGGQAPECAFADCKVPEPSNVAVFGALPLGGNDLTVPAAGSFDTSKSCYSGTPLGDCSPIVQTVGPEVCVCRSGSLVLADLTVTGARGLVLLVHGSVTITGTLDIAASHETGGPGAEPAVSAEGLFVHGTAELVPLRGGAGSIDGGQGGGAIQISAGTSITVEGTIQAGGGGGLSRSYEAATSGGSGGAILVEAPIVKIQGQLLANGGGGGGGFGRGKTPSGDFLIPSPGQPGSDARAALRERASGGRGSNSGCVGASTSGGDGGWGGIGGSEQTAGRAASQVVCAGQAYYRVEAGGAGGGVGRIRLNAATGLQVDATSFVSPAASTGILTLR